MQKRLTKLTVIIMCAVMMLSFVACGNNAGSTNNNGSNGGGSTVNVPILPDLTDYGSKPANYNPARVVYDNITIEQGKLEARRAEEERKAGEPDADPTVIVKIFIDSSPADVINAMGKAGLTTDKMKKVVDYLVGDINASVDIDSHLVEWHDDDTWSFFDDVDYLDKLQEKADDEDHLLNDDQKDKAQDNVQRQRRKMMRQIFEIGLLGNEFSMLVIEEIIYSQEVVHTTMYGQHQADNGSSSLSEDEFIKADLSHDTLSYFKSFNEFTKDSKKNACSLYGYYYDYNKAGYDALDDATFEKELKYGHQATFTESEWFDYLSIQRTNYTKSYRYSYSCYQKFYNVHFSFQGLIETYDLDVYTNPMEANKKMTTAFTNEALTYSKEMLLGVNFGFNEQLIMSDWLYRYSLNETAMKAYNVANTNYENVKNMENDAKKAGPELAYNIERLKIADYILANMAKDELTKLLKYQIKVYSADLISAIQQEKKDQILLSCDLSKITKATNPVEYTDLENEIGRSKAYVVQLENNWENAGINGQLTTAQSADWPGIRVNIQETLNKDYQKEYDTDVKRRDGFEDTLIKKEWSCGAALDDTTCKDNPGGAGHVGCTEVYDTEHSLSRFLNSHEDVLRHAIGEVKVTPKGKPNKATGSTGIYYEIGEGVASGTYYPGIDSSKGALLKDLRLYDNKYVTAYSGGNSDSDVSFDKGMTLKEGLADAGKSNFLTEEANKIKITEKIEANDGQSNNKYSYTYVFHAWYIDSNLLYEVDMEHEEVDFDLVLYPGYVVTKAPVA